MTSMIAALIYTVHVVYVSDVNNLIIKNLRQILGGK